MRGKPYHDFAAPQVAAPAPAVEGVLDRDDLGAPGSRERELQRVLVRLGAAVHEEHALEAARRERGEPLGGLVADPHPNGVALKGEHAGLARDGLGDRVVTVAERRDRVAAVEIEHLPAVGVLEEDASAAHRLERQQRVHLVEMRMWNSFHQSHPGDGVSSPKPSGQPSSRFAHCMQPPAAPFSRLSITLQTTIVSPWTLAETTA